MVIIGMVSRKLFYFFKYDISKWFIGHNISIYLQMQFNVITYKSNSNNLICIILLKETFLTKYNI